jgi:hypothetical protein
MGTGSVTNWSWVDLSFGALPDKVPIPQKNMPMPSCLSFWQFEGGDDGLDIKNDFKRRFDNVAAQLTASERTDVVEEAVQIFKMCREMVELLDAITEPEQVVESKMRCGFAVVDLVVGVWDLLWTFFALVFRYDSIGPSRNKIHVEKTMGIESDSDEAEHW